LYCLTLLVSMATDNDTGVTPPIAAKRRKPRQRSHRFSESDSDYEEEVVSRKPRTHARTYKSDAHPRRRLKSAQQLSVLQTFFDTNTKPSKEEINELADTTALSFQEIQRWFRNERHKHKKAQGDDYEELPPTKKSPRRKRSRDTETSASASSATHTTKRRTANSESDSHEYSPHSSPAPGDGSSPPHSPSHSSTAMIDSPASSPRSDSPEPHPEEVVPPPPSQSQPVSLSVPQQLAPLITQQTITSTAPRRVFPQSILSATSPSQDMTDFLELPLPLGEDPYSPIAASDVDAMNFSWDAFAEHIGNKDFVDIYFTDLPSLNNFTLSPPAFLPNLA